MIIYQVKVWDRNTKELIEVSSLFLKEEKAEKEKKHLEEVYSDPSIRIVVAREFVIED